MRPIIVDCENICHIAMHSMGGLSYGEIKTGVIFGFFMKLGQIANQFNSNNFVLCWDSNRSIRRKMYPDYKRKRIERKKQMNAVERKQHFNMVKQIKELRKVLPRLGFKNSFLKPGHESDDLMARLVYDNNVNWLMVTSDNDMYQCLKHCDIYNPQTKKVINHSLFVKKFKISPRLWPMAKAIGGCATDNVEGVKGVGDPKSETSMALKYLRGELKESSKVYKRISDSLTIINRNLELVHLPLHTLRPNSLPLVANEFNKAAFIDFFSDKYFRSFLRNMDKWDIFFTSD